MAKSERAVKVTMCGSLYQENSPCIDGDRDAGMEEDIWWQEAPGGIEEQQLQEGLEAWKPKNGEGCRFGVSSYDRSFREQGDRRGHGRTWESPYLVGKKRKEGRETN